MKSARPSVVSQHDRLTLFPALRGNPAARRDQLGEADADRLAKGNIAVVVGHDGLADCGEGTLLALVIVLARQVVQADDHVLRGHGDRTTVGRFEDVVGRQHEDTGFCLRLGGQRQVHCHLVTVEVGVEGRTDERVQLNGLTLNELRLKCLDAETVQGWGTVQQDRVIRDDLFEDVPHLGALALNERRFAALMFFATCWSTRRFCTKGLKSSRAMAFGRPHWCSLSVGPTTITERPE